MEHIVITGNSTKEITPLYKVHSIVRPGIDAVYIGMRCNDGRSIRESARYKEATRLGIPIVLKKLHCVYIKTKKKTMSCS